MMKKLLILVATVAVLVLGLTALADTSASALDVFEACDKAGSKSAICNERKGGPTVQGIISQVVNIMMGVLGSISVIMIVYAGIRMTTSAGNPETVKSAKNTILYAVVGVVVALLGFAIVAFVDKNFSKAKKSSTHSTYIVANLR